MDDAVSVPISDTDTWQLPQSLCFLQGSLSMSYTHMIDKRCIQANDKMITLLKPDCTVTEKGHYKDDYIVYCVRNNISKWTKYIYVGAPS